MNSSTNLTWTRGEDGTYSSDNGTFRIVARGKRGRFDLIPTKTVIDLFGVKLDGSPREWPAGESICLASLKACKAEAERIMGSQVMVPLVRETDAVVPVDLEPYTVTEAVALPEAPAAEPTDAEIEAAYDAACPCMPEIEAAARRLGGDYVDLSDVAEMAIEVYQRSSMEATLDGAVTGETIDAEVKALAEKHGFTFEEVVHRVNEMSNEGNHAGCKGCGAGPDEGCECVKPMHVNPDAEMAWGEPTDVEEGAGLDPTKDFDDLADEVDPCEVSERASPFKAGDIVTVTEGEFAGMTGQVDEVQGRGGMSAEALVVFINGDVAIIDVDHLEGLGTSQGTSLAEVAARAVEPEFMPSAENRTKKAKLGAEESSIAKVVEAAVAVMPEVEAAVTPKKGKGKKAKEMPVVVDTIAPDVEPLVTVGNVHSALTVAGAIAKGVAALGEVADRAIEADAQAILNRLIWEHGTNLPQWAEWEAICLEAGLLPGAITKAMLKKANDEVKARIEANLAMPADQLEWKLPYADDSDTATYHVWESACRILKVIRSIPKFSEIMPAFRVLVRSKAKTGKDAPALVTADLLDRHYRSLERAFEGAEAEYRSRTGIKRTESNLVKILAHAKENGLDVLPAMAYDTTNGNETPTNEEEVMKITEQGARDLLVAAGLPKADVAGYTMKRLTMKLTKLAELEGATKPDGEMGEIWDKVVKAGAKGKEIQVGDLPAPVPATKAAAKAEAASAKNGTPKASKAPAELDFLGYKKSSRFAQINGLLSADEPKTVKQLQKEGDIPGNYRKYLEELVEKKFVKGDHDKGYVLTAAAVKAKTGK